jgi:hypothetical protein
MTHPEHADGQRPADSTDEPTTNADAAALLEGVLHSAEPDLTDDECARLDAVIAYLRGTDTTPITPSPSPYPTGSVASRAPRRSESGRPRQRAGGRRPGGGRSRATQSQSPDNRARAGR